MLSCLPIVCFIILRYLFLKKPKKSFLMTNWPLIRMLPSLLAHRIYDVIVELLENSNLTFQFKGPLLAGMDMLFSVHRWSQLIFTIYYTQTSWITPKALSSKKSLMFSKMCWSTWTLRLKLWKNYRKAAQVTLNHQRFPKLDQWVSREVQELACASFRSFCKAREDKLRSIYSLWRTPMLPCYMYFMMHEMMNLYLILRIYENVLIESTHSWFSITYINITRVKSALHADEWTKTII